jgi:hypothetical protein
MLAWHVPFLGWRRLPADLSGFEIAHFFKPVDIRAVRSRYKESLRLGAALQLGFLTMCGRPLSTLQRVPTELLQHLGKQLAVPAPDFATSARNLSSPARYVIRASNVGHLLSRYAPVSGKRRDNLDGLTGRRGALGRFRGSSSRGNRAVQRQLAFRARWASQASTYPGAGVTRCWLCSDTHV